MSASEFPLVSVAIATYNGEKYLEEQLDSIYAQTYPNLEVVVTDDCSHDRTVEILETYRQRHGLKYWINEKNLGFIKNFEQAMSKAEGELIALADQDDIWKPDRLSTLVKEIGHYTLIYAPAKVDLLQDGSYQTLVPAPSQRRFLQHHGTGKPIQHLLAFNWVVSHQVMFWRTLLEEALPIPEHQQFHDAWLAAVASTQGGIKWLDADLMIYRKHQESATYDHSQGSQPFAQKLRRLFKNDPDPTLRPYLQREISRLSDALNSPVFKDHQPFLADLIYAYKSRLEPGLHWRAFSTLWQYQDLFFQNASMSARIRAVISSLIKQA